MDEGEDDDSADLVVYDDETLATPSQSQGGTGDGSKTIYIYIYILHMLIRRLII
jgi:hypothetical protein